jgi:hypothetical protein
MAWTTTGAIVRALGDDQVVIHVKSYLATS